MATVRNTHIQTVANRPRVYWEVNHFIPAYLPACFALHLLSHNIEIKLNHFLCLCSVAIDLINQKITFYDDNLSISASSSNKTYTSLLEEYLHNPKLDLADIVGMTSDILLTGVDTVSYPSHSMPYFRWTNCILNSTLFIDLNFRSLIHHPFCCITWQTIRRCKRGSTKRSVPSYRITMPTKYLCHVYNTKSRTQGPCWKNCFESIRCRWASAELQTPILYWAVITFRKG